MSNCRKRGSGVAARDEAGVVESVKAASDIYAPVTGTVLGDQREAGGRSGTGQPGSLRRRGGFFRIEPDDIAELGELLDADTYLEACAAEEE